jgi:hypothetical protein
MDNVKTNPYQEVPAEIGRIEILKAPSEKLREWAKLDGFENLNFRLQGMK